MNYDTEGLIEVFASAVEGDTITLSGECVFDSDTASVKMLEIKADNVSVIGKGDASIVVKGIAETALIYASNRSGIKVDGVKFIGNIQASNFSQNGTAIWIEYTDAAGDDSGRVVIEDCEFENFKGVYWVSVQNLSTAKTVQGVKFHSLDFSGGSDIAPSNLGMASRQLGVHSTAGGTVNRVSVKNCNHDAYYVKQAIAFQGKAEGITVENCDVYRTGRHDALDNTGRYAIMFYGSIDDVSVVRCKVDEAHDCGIYCLNTANLRINNCEFLGVTGTTDATLPKGAVVFNDSSGTINNNEFRGNKLNISVTASSSQTTPAITSNSFDGGTVKLFAPIVTSGHDNYGGSITRNEFINSGIAFRSGLGQPTFWHDFEITQNEFLATKTSQPFITGDLYKGFPGLRITRNEMVKLPTATVTHAVRGDGGPAFADGVVFEGNRVVGTYSNYSASFYSTKNLKFNDNRIEDSRPAGTGITLYLINATGEMNDNSFVNCELWKIT